MKYYLTIIGLLLLISCQKNETVEKPIIPDQITLIFLDRPDNGTYYPGDGSRMTHTGFKQLTFTDDHGIQHWLNTDSTSQGDTIRIPTQQDYLEILHSYRGLDQLSVLVEKGDTIIFTYNDLKPQAYSKRHKAATFELNIGIKKIEDVYQDKFNAFNDYWLLPFEEQVAIDQGGVYLKSERFLGKRNQELASEKKWLEKIYNEELISDFHYQYYNHEIELLKLFAVNEYEPQPLDVFQKILRENGDTYSDRTYYQRFAGYYLTQLSKNVTKYSFQNSGGGGSYIDFGEQYDILQADTFLTPKLKDVLACQILERMITQMRNPKVTKTYFEKFKRDAINPNVVNFLKTKYQLENTVTDELALSDLSGDTTTIEQIITANQGKVVIIDFWASWCAPCLKEIPHTKEVIKTFEQDDFVWIYISKDNNEKVWKQASHQHQITENSYLVSNLHATTFFNKMNIQFIPTYFLYDKNGQLVYADAPRPSDKELLVLIKKYL